MSKPHVHLGVIGDFNPRNPSHPATTAALEHAGKANGVTTLIEWLPTPSIGAQLTGLDQFDGLLGAPGSPYASMDGALAAIRFARERHKVFLGTCGGFQHAIIEFARNVLGVAEAEHEETAPAASALFIRRLACSLVGRPAVVNIFPGTRLAEIYGCASTQEQFWCNFGPNPARVPELVRAGLVVSATDSTGGARAVELPGRTFFLGTLFLPQLTSTEARPHPVMRAFVQAAAA